MFIKNFIVRFRDFTRSRVIIGVAGALSANILIAALIEQFIRISSVSMG